jgi:hypothetical protein
VIVTASPEAAADPLPAAADVELDALSLPEEHALSTMAAAIAVAAMALRIAVRGNVVMSWPSLS